MPFGRRGGYCRCRTSSPDTVHADARTSPPSEGEVMAAPLMPELAKALSASVRRALR